MKNHRFLFCLVFLLMQHSFSFAQEINPIVQKEQVSELFLTSEPLPIQMHYSNNSLRKKTVDGDYLDSQFTYQLTDGSWKSVDIKIRVRGNNRLKNCYFAPIKIKIKKSKAEGTVFDGNKKLKLVLPCYRNKNQNDYVLKEYLAYRLYELISPYHFKTRLINLELTEPNSSNEKKYLLKGFLIEDIDNLAERYDAHVLERTTHPLNMDDRCAVLNDLFQYMIGNTDYSMGYQHNQKLLFVDKQTIPVPYDFDMCGLVNANYASVSTINAEILPIKNVRQRMFRGFKRDTATYHGVRQKFLSVRGEILNLINQLEPEFEDSKEYSNTRSYIESFFEVLMDPRKFDSEILQKVRTE